MSFLKMRDSIGMLWFTGGIVMHEKKLKELRHLVAAMNRSMQMGAAYLIRRLAPNGPIMREPHLSYVHKAVWGMYAAGVDHDVLWRVLDWVEETAFQSNGDFFFPREDPEYRITQRVYRPLTFGKVAVWIGHPLFTNPRVVRRILQYQHEASGGVFHYIGEDPEHVEEPPTIGTLNTTFFGQLMLALNRKREAIRVGEWIRRFVNANEESMARDGVMYTWMTPDDTLVTQIPRGAKITSLVNNADPKQEFWQVGTCMAYLCRLYEAMRERWGYSAPEAQPVLDGALTLLDYEATMPVDTYRWPSKCKVGWGAGELLRVLTKYEAALTRQMETAYRIAAKVAMFTFLDNQLPTGGWACMHYPLADGIPELAFDYKPRNGRATVPETPIPGSKTVFLPAEEITGEFLGEMKAIELGVHSYMRALMK
jgi:hypothetical protein